MGSYYSTESTKSNEFNETTNNVECTVDTVEGTVESINSDGIITTSENIVEVVLKDNNQPTIFETQESNILEIVTTKIDVLKKILRLIGEVTSECQFSFQNVNEGGRIIVTELHDNKTILLKLVLKGTGFDFYKCSKSKITARLYLPDIDEALGLIGADDTNTNPIIISMKKDKETSIFITRMDNSGFTEQVELPCKESVGLDIPLPKTTFQGKIVINAEKFRKICERICSVSDLIKISLTDKEVSFSSKYYNLDFRYKHSVESKVLGQTIENSFFIDGMLKFIKYFKSSDKISIYIKKDFPLVIHGPFDNFGSIYVFTSPIEEGN